MVGFSFTRIQPDGSAVDDRPRYWVLIYSAERTAASLCSLHFCIFIVVVLVVFPRLAVVGGETWQQVCFHLPLFVFQLVKRLEHTQQRCRRADVRLSREVAFLFTIRRGWDTRSKHPLRITTTEKKFSDSHRYRIDWLSVVQPFFPCNFHSLDRLSPLLGRAIRTLDGRIA